MTLRHRIANRLLLFAVRRAHPRPTLEGIAMASILARLAALEAAQAAHGETLTSVATKDDVSAVSDKLDDLAGTVGKRLDAVEAEIGTEDDAGVAAAAVTDFSTVTGDGKPEDNGTATSSAAPAAVFTS